MHGPLPRRHGGSVGGLFSFPKLTRPSVENVKRSLGGRNHVGLRKDYNTIYLEKHNVTPRVTSRGIPELLNHCGPLGRRRERGGACAALARPEEGARTKARTHART